jgi:hypothetical protein
MDWRPALLILGLAGVPVAAAILWQSRILQDQAAPKPREAGGPTGRELLMSRRSCCFSASSCCSPWRARGPGLRDHRAGKLLGHAGRGRVAGADGYMAAPPAGTLVGGWWRTGAAARPRDRSDVDERDAAARLHGPVAMPGSGCCRRSPLVAGLGARASRSRRAT